MKKTAIIALFSGVLWYHGISQSAVDALRYSRIFYSGTARFNGLGGAFGAVGADFSTLAVNPAGLGLYRASEMSVTLAPTVGYSSSIYNASSASDFKVNAGLGNFGAVFNIPVYKQNKSGAVKNLNFGFGLNRQNDFNNRVVITGRNDKSSMMQNWVEILNARQLSEGEIRDSFPFDIGLAYDAYLINLDKNASKPDSLVYFCDAPNGGVIQNKQITTYGSMNEFDFSVGTNIADQLFVGLTVGVPTINYYEKSVYTETKASDSIKEFLSLSYYSELHTRGTGINVKLGLIYAPVKWVRIGAAIHSPTWYPTMRDNWSTSMQSWFTTTDWNSYQTSPLARNDYRLTTPFRAFGSMAFIIGQYGLFSADYEYVNYSQARFHASYDDYKDVNNAIRSNYKSWGNLRFGTEWRMADFRIRGGFGYFSSPDVNGTKNGERYQVSAGLGYRSKYFFADVTYVWSKMSQDYYLYDPVMVNPATVSYYTNTVSTTVGIRF